MMPGVSEDRRLRDTFDRAAALYARARPEYPDALYDDLLALTGVAPPARLLEVGCGPGTATAALARRGFGIVAVELGRALAEQARLTLAECAGVTVVNAAFEDWEPPPDGGGFDLVYAATSWHWVDPAVRYRKAAALLRPGGHLAVWGTSHAFPSDFDPFFTEIQPVYNEIGESSPGEWPPPPPEQAPDARAEFEASGHFEVVGVRRYVWALRYSTDAYLDLLDTFSGHLAMESAKRAQLYAGIRRRLADRPGDEVTRHWVAVLTVGRRTG